MTLTSTKPEVYIESMTIFISCLYISLEGAINHLNTIKINSYPLDNVEYFYDEILVDVEHIVGARVFKPENLGYITQFLRILLTEYFDLHQIGRDRKSVLSGVSHYTR